MTEKRRVILINGRFLTQPVTGVQRFARELISAFGKLKGCPFRFVIAVPGNIAVGNIEGIDIVNENSSYRGALWQQIRLPFLMKKLKADLLWSPCNIGPIISLRPHVVNLFDASIFEEKGWFEWKFRTYYQLMFRILGNTSASIITCSNFSKTGLVKYGIAPSKKINVIYGGVSTSFKKVENPNPIGCRYVFSLGSRDPRKNVSSLVKAWTMFSPEIKRGRKLVIAGGKGKSFLDENIGDISNDIQFTGYVKDEDLPALYTHAECFVYPSLYEGFGLPPLEAMACGCPVVVSNAASLPEVCGDAAYYVNPNDVESIADGIYEVATNEGLRENLIQKGLERAKIFTWEKAAIEHLKVFEEVINS